ncbi:P-loop containing nucleoside triphosphate hydrolase protein [Xylaria cubensis]|nr:P-loop containing nucleoside triphosphate hydrolase protein [Xylaria cubensis]
MKDQTKVDAQYDGSRLQNKDHRNLLDVIDTLRSQGIGRYVDLPQIIVCGDQSSGKSSVLEAISGLSFPTKDNLCTRFATELILRRSPESGVHIRIIPSHDRPDNERQKLEAFQCHQEALDIGPVVEEAKQAMGLDSNNRVFSTDILRVEISGPSQPHLTMVDLPGLFLAGNKDQSEEDAKLVRELVLSYMKKPRSIILAVVSAKSDFALQQVTRHARALDPDGSRTLGLITKPDTLDKGSDSERFYVELAQNQDVKFRLGWHVLRNRSYASRDTSTAERDEAETEFFSTGLWTALDAAQLGVANLRIRMSNVLHDQIINQLPSVLDNVETGIRESKEKLTRLGDARGSVGEQRRHLFRISTWFTTLAQASIDGNYTDPFFFTSDNCTQYSRRLRAVVQNTLMDFAKEMRARGQAKRIIEHDVNTVDDTGDMRSISRNQYIEEVKIIMRESRGRELPGSYNPLIVAELFSKQCKPWESLVGSLNHRMLASVFEAISAILRHVADEETAAGITRFIINPLMDTIKTNLENRLADILQPHLSGHPITYNHYLTENFQKKQDERRRLDMEKRLTQFFGSKFPYGAESHTFTLKALIDSLMSSSELDMDVYSCSAAIDMMEAYYKVALKTVIDDVSALAIEICLVQEVPRLLTPEGICNLSDEEVHSIASESLMSASERKRLNEKLSVLQRGLAQLGKFKRDFQPQSLANVS